MRDNLLIAVVGMLFLTLVLYCLLGPSSEEQRRIDDRACLTAGQATQNCVHELGFKDLFDKINQALKSANQ